ncbi:MAG: hypothetical protein H7X71_06415, partial [Chitinophagales bacterium]|nr:hypothetical protein [Chitinophagales bacterium]
DSLPSFTIIDNTTGVVFENIDCDKKDFRKIIEAALLKDDYISDKKKYEYAITDRSFSVNGKEKRESARQKYLKLLLDNSCISFGESYSFRYDRTKNNEVIETSSDFD